MFCSNCGISVPSDAVFCHTCGTKLIKETCRDNSPLSRTEPQAADDKLPPKRESTLTNLTASPPIGEIRPGIYTEKQTPLLTGTALLILILSCAWSFNYFYSLKTDDPSDYVAKTGKLEAAQEKFPNSRAGAGYLDTVKTGYLDIKVQGQPILFRVPAEEYAAYFKRTAFFEEAKVGEIIRLYALKSDWTSPKSYNNETIIFVRGVQIDSRVYASIHDHISFQRGNNLLILAFAIFLALCVVIVLGGALGYWMRNSAPKDESHGQFCPLVFSGKGSDIFRKRGLLALISLISIVGAPVAIVLIHRYVASRIRLSNGANFTFVGSFSTSYFIFMLLFLIQITEKTLPLHHFYNLFQGSIFYWAAIGSMVILFQVLFFSVQYLQVRFFWDNLRYRGSEKLTVDIPLGSFIVRSLIGLVSALTIFGLGWYIAWSSRWIFSRVSGPNFQLRFVGTGFDCLWRGIVAIFAFLPIFTIPWSVTWYSRWFFSLVESKPISVKDGDPAS